MHQIEDKDREMLIAEVAYWRNHAWRVFLTSSIIILSFILFEMATITSSANALIFHSVAKINMPYLYLPSVIVIIVVFAILAIRTSKNRVDNASNKLGSFEPEHWFGYRATIILLALILFAMYFDLQDRVYRELGVSYPVEGFSRMRSNVTIERN